MKKTDIEIFEVLKEQVAKTFLKENTALSTDISEWKGNDIIKFQEDLLVKVKGRVSEKWFYNYFRNDIQKLPRIDMLDLLSEYVEEESWSSFKKKHSKNKRSFNNKWIVLVVLIPLSIIIFLKYVNFSTEVEFCFVDENAQTITDQLKITVKKNKETEKVLHTNSDGCVYFKLSDKEITMNIESPYHKKKKVYRKFNDSKYKETISLETDIYSLMLRHYSNSKTSDWKLRKQKLDKLIADDAIIYQRWFGKQKGVELYSKEDFILQLTVPTSMLRNLEILETVFDNGEIKKLGFKINK